MRLLPITIAAVLMACIPVSMVTGFDIDDPTIREKAYKVELDGDNIQCISPYPRELYISDCDWHPSGLYCIFVGAGTIIRYEEGSFIDLTSEDYSDFTFSAIDWNKNGSKALISGFRSIGEEIEPIILEYDGTSFKQTNTWFESWSISWKPDGSYALIGSIGGSLVKYTYGGSIIDVSDLLHQDSIMDISWKPDGSSALIATSSELLEYNETGLSTKAMSGFSHAQWSPSGDYALLGSGYGIFRYNESYYKIDTKVPLNIEFDPNQDIAYIVDLDGLKSCDGTSVSLLEKMNLGETNVGISIDPILGSVTVAQYKIAIYEAGNIHYLTSVFSSGSRQIKWNPILEKAIIFNDRMYEIDGSEISEITDYDARDVCWNNEGTLAYGTLRSEGIAVIDDGKVNVIYPPNSEDLRCIAWNPKEDYGLVGGEKNMNGCLFRFDGSNFKEISNHSLSILGPIIDITWSGDGTYALINTGKLLNEGRFHWLYEDGKLKNVTEEVGYKYRFQEISFALGTNHGMAIGEVLDGSTWVKGGLFSFEDLNFTFIKEGSFEGIDVHPSGMFSVMVSYDNIYKIMGEKIESIHLSFHGTMTDIAWNITGDYALIIGLETIVKYNVVNTAPLFDANIPDVSIKEDRPESGKGIIDLAQHFGDDDLEIADLLTEHESGSGLVEVKNNAGKADIIQIDPDTYGKDRIRIRYVDKLGLESVSNWFTVTIEPTDDPVIIEDVLGSIPVNDSVMFSITQGDILSGEFNISDIDGDLDKIEIDPSGSMNVTGNHLSFATTNSLVGLNNITMTISDKNGSVDNVNIFVDVGNVNDPPSKPNISSPYEGERILLGNKTILSASFDDPDLHIPASYQNGDSGEVITYIWSSSVYGFIDGGSTKGTAISTEVYLKKGEQEILLSIHDESGVYRIDSVNVNVVVDQPEKMIPLVKLRDPLNGSVIPSTSVNLSWDIRHPYAGKVESEVLYGSEPTKLVLSAIPREGSSVTLNLSDGETYYWTVRSSYFGIEGKTLNGPFSFTVRKGFVPVYDIRISGPITIGLEAGSSKTFILTVENHGNDADLVRTRADLPSGIEGYLADEIELKPSQSLSIVVTVNATDQASEGKNVATFFFDSKGGEEKYMVRISITKGTDDVEGSIVPFILLSVGAIVLLGLIAFVLIIALRARSKTRAQTEPPTNDMPDSPGQETPPISSVSMEGEAESLQTTASPDQEGAGIV